MKNSLNYIYLFLSLSTVFIPMPWSAYSKEIEPFTKTAINHRTNDAWSIAYYPDGGTVLFLTPNNDIIDLGGNPGVSGDNSYQVKLRNLAVIRRFVDHDISRLIKDYLDPSRGPQDAVFAIANLEALAQRARVLRGEPATSGFNPDQAKKTAGK